MDKLFRPDPPGSAALPVTGPVRAIDQITLDLFSSEGAPDHSARLDAAAVAAANREDIARLKTRIAKAVKDSATWRVAGLNDKYLEAYSLTEALETQLLALEKIAAEEQTPDAGA